MSAALEMQGVVKCYGRRRALDGMDLAVPAGSIFGLVGSNGAGKTTSLAVSVGFLIPASGTVNLLGEGPFNPSIHTGRVSILPQDSRLPPYSRVEELLRFYGRLQGLSEKELCSSIEDVLEWTHLTDRRRSAIKTLSHGMIRRVTIAQTFLGNPELVLLDEPLNGLDPREASRVREIIRQRRGRQTILISSHNLNDIELVCDAVAFIEAGKVVRQDSLEAIVRRGHSVTYRLQGGTVPLEELKTLLPHCAWDEDPAGEKLTVRFNGVSYCEADINAAILPVLLRGRVGILEIRRGSDLESEYLAVTERGQPPSRTNGCASGGAQV